MNKRINLILSVSIITSLLSMPTFAAGGVSSAEAKAVPVSQEEKAASKGKKTAPKGGRMNKLEQIQHAKQDLASELEVDEGEISVVSAEEVMWPSGALGCPSPGKFYTQALVEGVQIVLEANKKQYSYHASKNGAPSYCPQPPNKKPTPLYEDS